MNLFDYLKDEITSKKAVAVNEINEEIDITDNKEYEVGTHPDSYYYNIKDPKTGFRFDIPMLKTTDPVYYFKYIRYMKLREQNEETFNKIMNWE